MSIRRDGTTKGVSITCGVACTLLLIAGSGAAETWHYLSGGKLSGVSSVGSHVWTVGQEGLLLYSEDNGATWRRMPRFTTSNLSDIEFWDQNLGLVTAEDNAVYRTTDNGATWNTQVGSAGKVRFVTRDIVWITGLGLALLSVDGGLTWESRACTDAGSGAPHWFSDGLNGWAADGPPVGSRVFRTTDGGQSWAVVSSLPSELSSYAAALAFAGADSGVLLRYVLRYAGHVRLDYRIWYTTTNGGNTWSEAQTRSGYPAPRGLDTDLSGRIYALENDVCTVFDDLVPRSAPFDTQGVDLDPFDVSASRGYDQWVCGTGCMVQKSSDNGMSWILARSGVGGPFIDIAFYDSAVGMAICQYTAVKSEDGGRTWRRALRARYPKGAGFTGLSLVPPAYAYVARDDFFFREGWNGRCEILKTTDTGATWIVQLSNGNANSPLYAGKVCFVDSLHGWHPGYSNPYPHLCTSVRTADGGATWTGMKGYSGSGAVGLSFTDTLNGWLATWNGEVYRTATGGDSWFVQWLGAPVRRLQMLDQQNGWALGDSGILSSSNGGDSWTLAFPAAGLSALHFIERQHGIVVGQHCSIFRTGDSGRTWLRDTCDFTSNLNAVFMFDSAHAWAAGDNGLVLGLGDWAVGADERHVGQPVYVRQFRVEPRICRTRIVVHTNGEQAVLQLHDLSGRLVRTVSVRTGDHELAVDTREMPAGVYYVSTLHVSGRQSVRVVKVR